MEKPGHIIKINPAKVVIPLLGVSVVVIIFSLIGRNETNINSSNQVGSFFLAMFKDEFYINGLTNVAVYWNMLILIILSVLAFTIANVKAAQRDEHRYEWQLLGVIFFYLAIDALSGTTQKFITLLKDLPDMQVGTYYNWLYLVATVTILLILLFFIRFYFHLDAPNKNLFLISMTLFILGAFREELVSGYYASLYGKKDQIYMLMTHAEEFMEYIGVILIIYMLLTYLVAHYSEIEFIAQEPERST
jgi:hypothetical protein